jgi:hypothetical protein
VKVSVVLPVFSTKTSQSFAERRVAVGEQDRTRPTAVALAARHLHGAQHTAPGRCGTGQALLPATAATARPAPTTASRIARRRRDETLVDINLAFQSRPRCRPPSLSGELPNLAGRARPLLNLDAAGIR